MGFSVILATDASGRTREPPNARGSSHMKSLIAKRSIVIDGHKTSVSLEDAFWSTLKVIANERNETLSQLIAKIDKERQQGNLSSAIRLFVLGRYQAPTDATVALREGSRVAA